MSTQAPIGGAPGRMLRIGITANTIAAIHPSMSVCTTRRRRAVWIATNAASTASTTIIDSSRAAYTRVPPDRCTCTRTSEPPGTDEAAAPSLTVHPSASPSTSTRVGWNRTFSPDPVCAVTSSGSTWNRSKGQRPASPSSRIWVSKVVADEPCGSTSVVRSMVGKTVTVISRARSIPPAPRNISPGPTEISTSARDALGCTSVTDTTTRTSPTSGATSVHPESLSSLAA